MNNREEALKWWNGLTSLRKTQLCDTTIGIVGHTRRHETLTGREIEIIFNILSETENIFGKLK